MPLRWCPRRLPRHLKAMPCDGTARGKAGKTDLRLREGDGGCRIYSAGWSRVHRSGGAAVSLAPPRRAGRWTHFELRRWVQMGLIGDHRFGLVVTDEAGQDIGDGDLWCRGCRRIRTFSPTLSPTATTTITEREGGVLHARGVYRTALPAHRADHPRPHEAG